MARWPTVTALWLGTATWLYAVLAVLELRGLDYDPTAPDEAGYEAVAAVVPVLVTATAVGLGGALLVGLASLATGRGRRVADLMLGLALGLGAWLLWAVVEPRPAAPVAVGAAAVVVAGSAVLPERSAGGRPAELLARLLLAAAALLAGWVCAHELAELSWQLRTWTLGYYLGLAVAAVMLVAALLGPSLAGPAWRWLVGVPLGLAALVLLAGAVVLFGEGYLVSGFEEVEHGWPLGGPPAYLGAGLLAAAGAALRGRWALAAGTAGAAVLVTLGVVFSVPEMRSGF